jgi:hypothetical protein
MASSVAGQPVQCDLIASLQKKQRMWHWDLEYDMAHQLYAKHGARLLFVWQLVLAHTLDMMRLRFPNFDEALLHEYQQEVAAEYVTGMTAIDLYLDLQRKTPHPLQRWHLVQIYFPTIATCLTTLHYCLAVWQHNDKYCDSLFGVFGKCIRARTKRDASQRHQLP